MRGLSLLRVAAASASVAAIWMITHCFKGRIMDWDKTSLWYQRDHSPKALLIWDGGLGFSGGDQFDTVHWDEPDFRKDQARSKAIIQKTSDNWKTRTLVFQGQGEIEGLYRTGAQSIAAKVTQVSMETLVQTAQFIGWDGNEWKAISHLPYRVARIWGSEGPAMLAVGYPQEGFDPVFASLSHDGGHTWRPVSLSGVNVAMDSLKLNTVLFPDGNLFCASPSGLSRLDLKSTHDSGSWQRVRPYPPLFKPLVMARRDQALLVFGSLPDKGFAIWYTRADGTGGDSLTPCRGIPDDFQALAFRDVDGQMYLVGRVPYLVKGEMRGFDHFILRSSTPGGSHWEDMRLPITGSLNAVDFGKDGRIWAVAAGNRLQIRKAENPRL